MRLDLNVIMVSTISVHGILLASRSSHTESVGPAAFIRCPPGLKEADLFGDSRFQDVLHLHG